MSLSCSASHIADVERRATAWPALAADEDKLGVRFRSWQEDTIKALELRGANLVGFASKTERKTAHDGWPRQNALGQVAA